MRQRPIRRVLVAALFVSALIPATPLRGQTTPSADLKAPAFEVVSIVPRKSFEPGGSLGFQPGGRFQGTNIYVLALIATAFGKGRALLPAQIEGGPDWIRVDRFDIVAKTDTLVDDEAKYYRLLPAMLRPVLENRFSLKTHWETRQLPIYALVLTHKDGSFGPQLQHSNCTPRAETIGLDDTPTAVPADRPVCKPSTIATGMIDGSGISLSSLASALSSGLTRVVLDRTGLRGAYDLTLRWTPDQLRNFKASADLPPGTLPRINGVSFDPDGPSLFTAVQEQLGLKLESTKAPVDVLVIDHVERPTPD